MESVAITRVINPCALIEVGDEALLTDPYFIGRGLPMNEPIGLQPEELPPLTAIVGGHRAFDHWQRRSLREIARRQQPLVLVGDAKMARGARRAGFAEVEVLQPGAAVRVSERLTVTALPGSSVLQFDTTAFLLSTPETGVYVSTEANDVDSVLAATDHHVDVAVLPIDGLTLEHLRRRLVMDATTALEATRRLGAHTLLPIHYSQRRIPGLVKPTSGIDDLVRLARDQPIIRIVHGRTGERVLV